MANDLNRCEFIGRLGDDPESRFMPSGDEVVNMRIAVGKSWKDKQSGDRKESTTWVPVVVFGGLAGVCSKYLKKGAKVYVAGEFRVRKWQAQDGTDRYSTEIVASDMQMLDSRQEGGDHAPRQPAQGGEAGKTCRDASGGSSAHRAPPQSGFDYDDDIPF